MNEHHLFGRLRYGHLQMLVMLGSSRNLHRASVSMNMSQPAASRMLQEIEDMFGCELFERLPRGMQPTALGRELLRFAEAALSGLERCAADLTARQQGGYGYLSIGTIMGAAPDLVMQAVAQIKALNPQLRLRIMGDTSDQVVRIAFDQALLRQELPMPADIIECSSVYSMQQLVQLTDAVMVLSESAMRDYLKMGLVKALPLTIDAQMAPFGLLRRKGEPVSRELQLFIDLLRERREASSGADQ